MSLVPCISLSLRLLISSSLVLLSCETISELMNRNMECAEQNFGSHADNMTAVVCYIKAKA